MNGKYPIEVIELRYKFFNAAPKKIQFFEDYRKDRANARLFGIIIRHGQIEVISVGINITEIKVINEKLKIINFKDSMKK